MDCNRFLLGQQIVFVSCHHVHLAFSGSHKVIGIFLTFVSCLSSTAELPSPSTVDRKTKALCYTF